MTARPPLGVHLYGRHVADIIDAGFGDTALQYTADAVDDPAGSRLSLSLPVRRALHPTMGAGGRWVRSLLPEGRALAWAVEQFGIPEDDRYGLIAELGRDVAGAVQIRHPEDDRDGQERYEEIAGDELAGLVTRARWTGLGLNRTRGVRLSLAGMQDKVLLHVRGGRYYLPIDGAPSTVIVKPEPPVDDRRDEPPVTGIATNELLCLTLARRSGLDTARAHIEAFGDTSALIVARYDRRLTAESGGETAEVARIHQEDLLGALGLDPLLKYELPQQVRHTPAGGFADGATTSARGGPSLRQLAELLATHLGRARLGGFVQAVTFNVAIGNADAHARNYSVLLPADGTPQLAPLYDLISTRHWEHLDGDAAQLVGGKDQIDDITAGDLIEEIATWGVPPRVGGRWVHETLDAVVGQVDAAVEECAAGGGDLTVAETVAELIRRRVSRMRG